MFTLTLCAPTARLFRVRKSTVSHAWKVAVALAKRYQCAVTVVADDGEDFGEATARSRPVA